MAGDIELEGPDDPPTAFQFRFTCVASRDSYDLPTVDRGSLRFCRNGSQELPKGHLRDIAQYLRDWGSWRLTTLAAAYMEVERVMRAA